jgi:hypothetical protein
MTKVRALAAAGLAALAILAAAAPALARSGYSRHPEGSYAYMYQNSWIKVCDFDRDGHRVRAWVNTNPGKPRDYVYTAWAPTFGCVEHGSTWGLPILYFRVCVQHEGCGPWWPRKPI